MTKITQLATALSTPNAVVAAFTDEQIQVLRVRVLPLFAFLEDAAGSSKYLNDKAVDRVSQPRRVKMPEAKYFAVQKTFSRLDTVYRLIDTITSSRSPARKAHEIGQALKSVAAHDKGPLADFADTAVKSARDTLKLKEYLTPTAIEFLNTMVKDKTMKLLVSSWPYIIKEFVNEQKSLESDNALMPVSYLLKGAGTPAQRRAVVLKRVLETFTKLGYKKAEDPRKLVPKLPDTKYYVSQGEMFFLLDWPRQCAIMPVAIIDGRPYTDGLPGAAQDWQVPPTYDAKLTVERWVEDVVAEANRKLALIKRVQTIAPFKMTEGLTLRLDDKKLEEIRNSLLTKGKWTYMPMAFGKGYTFKVNGTGKNASRALEKLVGKSVTFTTFDAD